MDFLQLAASRQSDRAYEHRPVEREKLERILQAACLAPSACNAQPWKFVVVDDPELARRVGKAAAGLGMNQFAKEAPVHILIVEESMNLCINHYDRNVQTLNDLCDVVIVTFGFLVQRESTENRPLVFKAELDVVQALLLQMHDTDIGRFNPNFFLRILVGLFKEIVVGEKDKKVREELAVQFATLMRTVGPSSCPAFLVAWMQLYTMPQVLRLLIGEKIPQLVSLAGDMIVSLFSLTVTHFVTVLDNYCNACINLLQLLCISFPGFLARRCSELIRYLSGRIREIVLSDCPPEFDIAYSKEDPETFLSRVIEIRVEPNMIYKQELMRGNLLDATENVMRCKDLNTNGIYILRSLEEARAVRPCRRESDMSSLRSRAPRISPARRQAPSS